jgi:hypothetical protein
MRDTLGIRMERIRKQDILDNFQGSFGKKDFYEILQLKGVSRDLQAPGTHTEHIRMLDNLLGFF